MFFILKPVGYDFRNIVSGYIGLVLYDSVYQKLGMAYDNEEEPFFSDRYVTIDTDTGVLCFFTSAYG